MYVFRRKNADHDLYVCFNCRNGTKDCNNAKCHLLTDGTVQYFGNHSERCTDNRNTHLRLMTESDAAKDRVVTITDQQNKLALEDLDEKMPLKAPTELVRQYMASLSRRHTFGYSGMLEDQMINFITNLRTKKQGGDVWRTIEANK